MSTRTKLILLLVVITLLFVAVLFADILLKREQKDPDSLGSLGSVADQAFMQAVRAMAPELKLNGLRCGQQRVNKFFSLDASQPDCSIRIGRKSGTEVRSAELSASGNNLDIYVFAEFDEEKFPERKRDSETCIQDEDALNPFRLEVTYVPRDASGSDWNCWLQQERGEPVALVVLEKGGRLELACVGCDSSSRSVRLQMR